MPKLMTDDMDKGIQISGAAGSSFQFSAIKIGKLGASDYTLVTIAVDISSSVDGDEKAIEACIKSIIEACGYDPATGQVKPGSARAENLLFRMVTFNENVVEVHGFILLNSVDFADYVLRPRGMTALYQASYESLASTLNYAESLTAQDFNVNGIMFVITDGMDNRSKETPFTIAQLKDSALKGERIESMLTILIGINVADLQIKSYLETFKEDAKFDQFIPIDNATPSELQKLAAFVSKSISSQSQSLGTGGPSQALAW